MKVLVAHREENVSSNIRAKHDEWFVRSVNSGLDGLLACRAEYFDLILCGLDLPVVTGIEMVRSIRNFSNNNTTSIIILADGHETPEHVRLIHKMNATCLTLEEVNDLEI